MSRPAAAALVALALVLAGCGSAATPSTPTPTRTPTATPTPTPRSTAAALDPASVPGVSADGVDVGRLTAAHDARLNRTSYRMNATVRRGPTHLDVSVVTAAGPVPTYVRTVRPNRTREEYYDERYYRRQVVDGNVTYRITPYVGRADFSGASLIREYMSLARYEPTGTDRVGGTPVVVLSAAAGDLRSGAFGDATTTRFASSVRVDRNGVVRSFRFVATGTTADGRPFAVRVDLRVTGVGETTVPTPGWLSAAREASRNVTATPATTAAGG
ncbi:MAG: hypothetical protein ABEJ34_09145 [Haloferacaceae archaeon]